MNAKEIKRTLEVWQRNTKELESLIADLQDFIGLAPRCALYRSIYNALDDYERAIAAEVGAVHGILGWWRKDCRFGDIPTQYDDDGEKVGSLYHLSKIIEAESQ